MNTLVNAIETLTGNKVEIKNIEKNTMLVARQGESYFLNFKVGEYETTCTFINGQDETQERNKWIDIFISTPNLKPCRRNSTLWAKTEEELTKKVIKYLKKYNG